MSLLPRSIAEGVTAVTLAVLALTVRPTPADAQGRGIMQASATVAPTESAFRALQAARDAVSSGGSPDGVRRTETGPIVARVSVARNPRSVVVTIDYSRS